VKSRSFEFTVEVRSPGRQQEEHWQTIEPQEASFWKAASGRLSHRTYHHNKCSVEVALDWAPLVRRLIRDHNLLIPVRTGKPSSVDWYAKLSKPLRLKASCVVEGRNELSDYKWYPEFFVEYFLYEVFTVANLTLPGSAEFLNFAIQKADRPSSDRLELSAYYFAEWMIQSMDGRSPAAKVLDIDYTIDWFAHVNPRVTQKAENSTQRALYATYQLCRSNGQIDFVLWLFNALESLLSTRVGENFSGLVRRTSLLLQLNEKNASHLQKTLRRLYDLRSSFVHGGYEVPHPMHREPIDARLEDDYMNMLRLGTDGFAILGALFQALIEKQIPMVAFEERVVKVRNAP
jgi:hypothetical protein